MASRMQRLVRGPSEGWATLALLLLSVMLAGWSVGSVLRIPPGFYSFLPLSVLLGLILAKTRFNAWLLVISGLLCGLCLSFYQVTGLAESTTVLGQHSEVGGRLALWWQVVVAGGSGSDMLPFYFFLLSASWLVGFICSWFLFRMHNMWGALLPTGIAVVISIASPFPGGRMLYMYLYLAVALLLTAHLFNLERHRQWNLRGIQTSRQPKLSLHHAFWFATTVVLIISLLPVIPARVGPFAAAWDKVALSVRVIEDEFDRVFAAEGAEHSDPAHFFGSTQTFRGPTSLTAEPSLMVEAPFPIYLHSRSYDQYRGWGWETSESSLVSFNRTPEQSAQAKAQMLREFGIAVTSLSSLSAGEPIWLGGYPVSVSIDCMLEVPQPAHYRIAFEHGGLAPSLALQTLPLDLQHAIQKLQESATHSSTALTEDEIRSVLPDDLVVLSWGHTSEEDIEIHLERSPPILPNVISVRSARSHASETPYKATVLMSAATEGDLIAAGTDYPGWVLDRYLQLPDDMPVRVMALAQELTGDTPTPYEKAIAIRDYLRALEYCLDIDAPPDGADGVDYFLFELERGYCQYFASAMTVLLRASGVPSRLVVGYGPGELVGESLPGRGIHTAFPSDVLDRPMPDSSTLYVPDGQLGQSVFMIRDSHSWVEAFFPSYGWVTFEPTPSYSTVTRGGTPTLPQQDVEDYAGGYPGDTEPAGAPPVGIEDTGVSPDEPEDTADLPSIVEGTRTVATWPFWPLGLSISLAGLGVVVRVLWRRLLGKTTEAQVVYTRIGYLAALTRLGPRETHTPYEYGRTLRTALPEVSTAIDSIVDTYVRICYGACCPDENDRIIIGSAWSKIRNRLIRHALETHLLSKLR